MNALVTVEQAPTAGPHGEGHTVFSPRRQAEFLASLQLFGNVRLASEDYDAEEVEALQMEAYEAGGHEWWLVASEEALEASIAKAQGELSG
ncbi:hypothetical protein K3162_02445 [Qipengyuania xiapuensis]|uniref:Uncharacterized protein n=1 Tax=Qipengyuania xiapuensis TaxID=2867236 RepID=A0ABX8ZVI3_9SPHN|nr:hypothetical protein [Qipengyuania xiapuensis]QZD92919.1 hypothetical protein K3162_02445 [Qipengyuania xiapuensis]